MWRKKLTAFVAALALTIFSRAQQKTQDLGTAKPERKPNVVFILADNTGWGDWSAYGGQVPTPRIGRRGRASC